MAKIKIRHFSVKGIRGITKCPELQKVDGQLVKVGTIACTKCYMHTHVDNVKNFVICSKNSLDIET